MCAVVDWKQGRARCVEANALGCYALDLDLVVLRSSICTTSSSSPRRPFSADRGRCYRTPADASASQLQAHRGLHFVPSSRGGAVESRRSHKDSPLRSNFSSLPNHPSPSHSPSHPIPAHRKPKHPAVKQQQTTRNTHLRSVSSSMGGHYTVYASPSRPPDLPSWTTTCCFDLSSSASVEAERLHGNSSWTSVSRS